GSPRDVDVLACSGRLAPMHRCEDRDHRLQSGIDIRMRQAVGTRFAEDLAVMAQAVVSEPGLRLYRWRVGHAASPWPTLAVAGDRGIDQARGAGNKRLIVEPEKAQRAGPEIFDDDVRRGAQAQCQFARAGHIEIDADIALAGVLLRVIARYARRGRKREPRDIGPRRLDLDDLGAKVQQCAGTERTSEHAREIDNANARKRAAH